MNNKPKGKLQWWLLAAILWMAFIFYQSNTPYQKQDIKPFLKQYVQSNKSPQYYIEFRYDNQIVSNKDPYQWMEFWFRKAGHVGEYAILTFLLLMVFSQQNIRFSFRLLFSLLFSFLYAGLDEWHQSFVPGRTGHFIDVYTFDLAGIVLALFFYSLFEKVKTSARHHP